MTTPRQNSLVGDQIGFGTIAGKGQFADKTIIVTGAGAGTGLATALRIGAKAGRVIAVDINKDRLDDLLAGNKDMDLVPVLGDIADDATVAAVLAAAGDRVDGLANIVGAVDNFAPVHLIDDELWERVFRVNVTATMRLTRAVIPLMLGAGAGSVVNVASETELSGCSAGAAYTASKYAVLGLTKSSAATFGPQGLRFNAVAPSPSLPGTTGTPLQTSPGRVRPLLQTSLPMVPTSLQVAECITFLLSDHSFAINGTISGTDGGRSFL
ncbi:SDR family NAD(P)-dependent oxidoreductase [Pseudarthrobacter sp. R1]|uniref:SDR family NAD(P)-dependent oxidoreductase n=1 Tax=Pseudarthrobacter sp. R1 TaxID=2944934 RepID=UPI002109CFA7|nr:SDR family NAD(P)-dependent oxidoreductase [Pseudarthrobacter sp. R1]MCQ6271438.1 SDR family NAD(P)-dependent oxidoreductase [Pseudarthrobacter sp. R1]